MKRKTILVLATVLTKYIPVPVILTNKDGVVVRFNKAAEAFFSVPAEIVLGHVFSSINHHLGVGEEYKAIFESVSQGEVYRQVYARVVRGEVMEMTFAFQVVSVGAKSKGVGGIVMVGDLAISSSEVVSTGVAPNLPTEGCLPEINTIEQNMLRVSERIKIISKSSVTVLLAGKSGVGKEFFARIIHKHSPRKQKPFIAVNCRILDDKLEGELFGSKASPKSVLERCEGGTLYLGHVHKCTPQIQKRLLGLMVRRGFYHNVTGEFIESDVRLIVSMGQSIVNNISATGFNEDLYYRLSSTLLVLPSISERKADIPLLMRFFLELHHCTNLNLTDPFMRAIVAYDWPGNIREMVNTAQYIALAKIADRPVDVIDLPTTVRWQATKGIIADDIFDSKSDIPKDDAEVALRQFDGNVSQAAASLGISRGTFYRILGKEEV